MQVPESKIKDIRVLMFKCRRKICCFKWEFILPLTHSCEDEPSKALETVPRMRNAPQSSHWCAFLVQFITKRTHWLVITKKICEIIYRQQKKYFDHNTETTSHNKTWRSFWDFYVLLNCMQVFPVPKPVTGSLQWDVSPRKYYSK